MCTIYTTLYNKDSAVQFKLANHQTEIAYDFLASLTKRTLHAFRASVNALHILFIANKKRQIIWLPTYNTFSIHKVWMLCMPCVPWKCEVMISRDLSVSEGYVTRIYDYERRLCECGCEHLCACVCCEVSCGRVKDGARHTALSPSLSLSLSVNLTAADEFWEMVVPAWWGWEMCPLSLSLLLSPSPCLSLSLSPHYLNARLTVKKRVLHLFPTGCLKPSTNRLWH